MKQSAFLRIVSEAYKVEEKTVAMYARLMREAGLLTTGARGINAPHMHPLDAVRLTIALLSTGTAARAVESYRSFAAMVYRPERSKGPHPSIWGVHEGVTLESLLLRMFTADWIGEGAVGDDPFKCAPYLELQENQRIATIEHSPLVDGAGGKAGLFFSPLARTVEDQRAHAGIHVSRGIKPVDLMSCALPFALERRDHASYETLRDETEAGTARRYRDKAAEPEKGLWFERDMMAEGSA